MSGRYPGYDVLKKWRSASFDETTRQTLARRLETPAGPRYFSPTAWRVLTAVIERLLPQPDRAEPIPVAAMLDGRLADGLGEGYRDGRMPPDAWRLGLIGLDHEARRRGAAFADHPTEVQDDILRRVQAGEVDAEGWGELDPQRFFRDILLKTTAALYYAHPTAWSEIGFGGPASPRGYVRLGFNERDPWEADEAL